MLDGVQQAALFAVAEATEGRGLAEEQARHEVGAALRLSPATAGERTWVATSLRRRLPAALAALQAGEISYLQAAHLTAAVRELDDAAASTVEARVLARAADQTAGRVQAGRRAGGAGRRPDLGRRPAPGRRRGPDPRAGGLAGRDDRLVATMPAAVEHDAWTALTARATATQTPARAGAGTTPAWTRCGSMPCSTPSCGADPQDPRHDHPAPPPAPPTSRSPGSSAARAPKCSCGGAQTAAVVIDLPTLLGLAEQPGEIPGYGPIPAPVARAMAADRDWIRWTVHPATGQLLDRGAKTYRPSDPLRAFVADRDRVCGFPGCNRPAAQCDCDHVVTFAHHGQTIRINLGPLCRQHHNAKTHGRWKLHYDPDTGTKTWTSPLGKTYTKSTDPPLA